MLKWLSSLASVNRINKFFRLSRINWHKPKYYYLAYPYFVNPAIVSGMCPYIFINQRYDNSDAFRNRIEYGEFCIVRIRTNDELVHKTYELLKGWLPIYIIPEDVVPDDVPTGLFVSEMHRIYHTLFNTGENEKWYR